MKHTTRLALILVAAAPWLGVAYLLYSTLRNLIGD